MDDRPTRHLCQIAVIVAQRQYNAALGRQRLQPPVTTIRFEADLTESVQLLLSDDHDKTPSVAIAESLAASLFGFVTARA